MLAINQNYFSSNLNFFEASTIKEHSVIESMKEYIQVITRLHTLIKLLKSNFNNFDTYVLINKLDNMEKIDSMLINLEDLSEFTNDILKSKDYQAWGMFPIRYMVNKVEDWNMALQGLLLSRQAHL